METFESFVIGLLFALYFYGGIFVIGLLTAQGGIWLRRFGRNHSTILVIVVGVCQVLATTFVVVFWPAFAAMLFGLFVFAAGLSFGRGDN